jgi:uncharacterized protein (DUF488 family)
MIVQLRIDASPDDIMVKAEKKKAASHAEFLNDLNKEIASEQGNGDNAHGTVWTIGYEGRNIDAFMHELIIRRIDQLIDVRELAFSRKAGFSKSALRAKLEEAGITYCHIPELGSPSDIRGEFKNGGSVTAFMNAYRSYLDSTPSAYQELEEMLNMGSSVLMCFEKSYLRCHRKVIADKLGGDGYTIEHIP